MRAGGRLFVAFESVGRRLLKDTFRIGARDNY